jgi:dTDP-4-dehydrorhamnose reductase
LRIFITGNRGQLGRALQTALARHTLAGCDLPELSITDREAVGEAITNFAPDVVIHAAAWTDVDGCARDPDKAHLINGVGTQNVALACATCDAAMVYVSTNEVFDGTAAEPYHETDAVNPINPYAQSKVVGEQFTRETLTRYYIARTAWVFAHGGRNFSTPSRIIQVADERGALKVVSDEVGNPTYAPDLAAAIAQLVQTEVYGVYHLTNSGYISRYGYVREVLRLAGRDHISVEPISVDDYPRPSTPPRFAPLANVAAAALGITLRPWQAAVEAFLESE